MYKLLYPGPYFDIDDMQDIQVYLHENDRGMWVEISAESEGEITISISELDLLIQHLQAVKTVINERNIK